MFFADNGVDERIERLGGRSMPNDQQPSGYRHGAAGWGAPGPRPVPPPGPGPAGPAGPYPPGPRPPVGGPVHPYQFPWPPPPVGSQPGPWRSSTPPGQPWSAPTPPPPPRKTGVIIAACAAVVLLIAGGATVAVYRTSRAGSIVTSSVGTTSSTTSTATTAARFSPIPSTALPTTEQVRVATGLPFDPQSQPAPVELVDDETSPSVCVLADNPAVPSTWGPAIKTSGQTYAVGTVYSYSAAGGVQLAVFDTAAAAATTLASVTSAVQGCTTFSSLGMDVTPTSTSWTIADRRPADGRVSWVVDKNASPNSWHCAKAYRVLANIAAAATACGHDRNPGPDQLVDIMIGNATKD